MTVNTITADTLAPESEASPPPLADRYPSLATQSAERIGRRLDPSVILQEVADLLSILDYEQPESDEDKQAWAKILEWTRLLINLLRAAELNQDQRLCLDLLTDQWGETMCDGKDF